MTDATPEQWLQWQQQFQFQQYMMMCSMTDPSLMQQQMLTDPMQQQLQQMQQMQQWMMLQQQQLPPLSDSQQKTGVFAQNKPAKETAKRAKRKSVTCELKIGETVPLPEEAPEEPFGTSVFKDRDVNQPKQPVDTTDDTLQPAAPEEQPKQMEAKEPGRAKPKVVINPEEHPVTVPSSNTLIETKAELTPVSQVPKSLNQLLKDCLSHLSQNLHFCAEDMKHQPFTTLQSFDLLWKRITYSTNLLNALVRCKERQEATIDQIQTQGSALSLKLMPLGACASGTYASVQVYPVGKMQGVSLFIPPKIKLPVDRYFIIEGLELVIKYSKLTLVYNTDRSTVIDDESLSGFELDPDQSLEQILASEVKTKSLVEDEPELIASFTHVMSIVRQFTQELTTTIKLALQLRIPLSVKPQNEKALSTTDYQKLYNYQDLSRGLKREQLYVVGLLSKIHSIQLKGSEKNKRLGDLQNKYLCEFKSIQDHNTIPLILIENGFTALTSRLLTTNLVVCVYCERRLSANLEIYLECVISDKNVKIIGQTVPGFSYVDLFPKQEVVDQVTSLVTISSEIITRNRLQVFARVIDLNFIKFEFVCGLCDSGVMLSLSKCVNACQHPKPQLKIQIICTVTDQQKNFDGGEALMSLTNQDACKVFGINPTSIDAFKEYFFMHGVFVYKSYAAPTPEYTQVLDFFKSCQTLKKWMFECVPFCKMQQQKQGQQSNLESLFQQLRKVGESPIEDCSQLVFVNGAVKEVIECDESVQPRKLLSLHCFKVIDKPVFASNLGQSGHSQFYGP